MEAQILDLLRSGPMSFLNICIGLRRATGAAPPKEGWKGQPTAVQRTLRRMCASGQVREERVAWGASFYSISSNTDEKATSSTASQAQQ